MYRLVDMLKAAGFATRVDWVVGDLGTVTAFWPDANGAAVMIRLDRTACVPLQMQVAFGHGCARLSSHPEYPSPTVNPLIVRLIAICNEFNAGI
jgi:hypothetical protein